MGKGLRPIPVGYYGKPAGQSEASSFSVGLVWPGLFEIELRNEDSDRAIARGEAE